MKIVSLLVFSAFFTVSCSSMSGSCCKKADAEKCDKKTSQACCKEGDKCEHKKAEGCCQKDEKCKDEKCQKKS